MWTPFFRPRHGKQGIKSAPTTRSPRRPATRRFEVLEQRLALSTFSVVNIANSGPGSLRQAILDSNASAGVYDTIAFNIGGGGVQTIAPTSALPLITDPVTIDGTTQPGFAGSPIIELNGAAAGSTHGLFILAGNSTVRGLVINRFTGNGIEIQSNGNNRIEGCFLGTDVTGTLDRGNTGIGVHINSTNDNVIGGTAPGAGNVISGNDSSGIKVIFAMRNQILGNRVGTNAAGTAVVPNGGDGIVFNSASNNTVGGNTAAARNIVSGNVIGIYLLSNGQNNVVIGNYIGTDVTGTVDLGNRAYGVALETLGANGTRIGGATSEERNLISGNDLNGVFVNSHGNSVFGNYIGTDVTGTAPLGNSGAGVRHNFGLNTLVIGNVISANGTDGVSLSGQYTGSRVQANRIGTNATGTADLGNHGWGVRVVSAAPTDTDLRIGGMLASEANIIAYNDRAGVAVQHQDARGVAILGNSIFANDEIPVGSGLGIDLFVEGVTPNDVGDADTRANLQQNFPVLTAANISGGSTTITGSLNSTANTAFRIEFFSNVVADPTGFGEGQTYLGFTEVTTDAGGNVTFTVSLGPVSAGNFVTATATRLVDHDANGATPLVPRETSEFSQARIVVSSNRAPTATADSYGVNEDGSLIVAAPGVLANDSDPDGNALTAVPVSGTTNGALTLSTNGSFTYTPAPNFNGTDSFTYRASDGIELSAPVTVTITVAAVNDAPNFTKGADQTVPEDDGPKTVTNWATSISAGPANESGQMLQFVATNTNNSLFDVQPALTADGTLTYTAAADANGTATITVILKDNGGTANSGSDTSAPQTFNIIVTAVNDVPLANHDSAVTNEDTAVDINVLANDRPGPLSATDEMTQTLTVTALTQPANGSVVLNADGTVTYTPAANYHGPDSFSYTVTDSGAPPMSALAGGFVIINPINDAPELLTTAPAFPAINEDDVTNTGTAVTEFLGVLTINDVDEGALQGIAVTGVDNTHGTWQFSTDGGGNWSAFGSPSNTLATLLAESSSNRLRFVPAANYFGPATFTFRAWDQTSGASGDAVDISQNGGITAFSSAAGTALITVNPVNDAPVAAGNSYSTDEDAPLNVPAPGLLANDSDVDNALLSAVKVSDPSHGALTLNADGSFTYVSELNYFGPDSFTYKANDGSLDSNVVTVNLTVNSVNDVPVANAGLDQGTFEGETVQFNGNGSSDIEGDVLTYSWSFDDGGTATGLTPSHAYADNGSYIVTLTVSDGSASSTDTLTVTVNNVAPTAGNDSAITDEDLAVRINVLGNDSDPAGALDPLELILVNNGSQGTTAIDTKGTPNPGDDEIVYTPNAGANGSDSFTYAISDGDGGAATGIVTVQIRNLVDLSGRIFDDKDNDGLYEPGDSDVGIGSVTVQLLNQTSGAVLATQTTAVDGTYTFDVNLGAGTYKVVASQPAGFLDGKETAGNLGGIVDNSQDSNQITDIDVGAAGTMVDAVDYLFADIGRSQALGLVWQDFNDDGEVNFGEKAIQGVIIELTGLDDRGQTVNHSTTTDANGIYSFTDLRPSNVAGYTLRELQPAGYLDGRDALGTVNGVAVGDSSVNDTFNGVVLPRPGSLAENYNFGERQPTDGQVMGGQTATIGFWHNKNGQNLIKALNGGPSSTQLGNWLDATFPNMYAGLAGKTNAQVAEFYKTVFARTASTAAGGGPAKMDAQALAVTLATYVTNQTLAGTTAAGYGFLVTENGVGTRTFNVGNSGAAFGVANHSHIAVLDLLLAMNSRSRNGLLYDLDGDGDANDGQETLFRTMANDIFSAINEAGDI